MTLSSPVGHSSESGEQTVSVDPKAVPRLELRNITKAYPAVVANDNISLSILPGQIHAVLGENGAGKSTLMKIIYGVVKPDQGQILWDGQPVQISSPAAARQLGIGMVFQHFSLFDTLTVTENIALGLPASTNMQELAGRISETASQYGLDLDPQRHIHTLSVGECQRVEIVRALLGKPKLLILDEPTSVLTPQAVRRLLALCGNWLLRVAALSISATSSMKSVSCAMPVRSCVWARSPAIATLAKKPRPACRA